jgi:NAD dependent epimerase/dehydratase
MNWKDRKVLVTGAGGFIGSHLVEQLLSRGASVRAFVHYNSRRDPGLLTQLPAEAIARLQLLAGDLRDPQTVRESVAGMQTVFHLGALISIPYSYLHPGEVAETNMIGTLNVLQACRDLSVERLVHTSTSEVYGTALRVPIDESHPLQGQSPYSASKIGADKLAESFFCAYELPVVTVRPFNTYGPRQSGRAVIPTIITQALNGPAIRLGNLEARRDFTFVDDTVNGFLRAAEADQVEGQTFNLGTGEDITIGDLVRRVLQIVEKPMDVEVDPARLRPEGSEVLRLISDNRLAAGRLGWKPAVSLDEGLERTVEWIRSHLAHYQVGTYEF